MSFLKRDEAKHCVELVTGRSLTGTVELGTTALQATLFSYDEPFDLPKDEPVFVRTESGHFVSLHQTIVTGPRQTIATFDPPIVSHSWHVHADCAVVGHDPWQTTDLIRNVTFRVTHADPILCNREVMSRLGKRTAESKDLLELTEGNVTVRISYGGIYDIDFDSMREYWPGIQLEYAEGVRLDAYMADVYAVIHLLSLVLWAPLRPSEISISRLSRTEQIEALDQNRPFGEHRVEYVWSEPSFEWRNRIRGPFLSARTSDHIEVLRQCLATALRRKELWWRANSLMMTCLFLDKEVSANRLLSACRWFEEIPLARSPPGLPDEAVTAIAVVAANKAGELGFSDIEPRIAGALRVLRRETRADRFARLLGLVGDRYGPMLLGEDAARYLRQAFVLRGSAAHGHFASLTDEEFRTLHNAVLALEALCVLLTAADLPLDQEALSQIQSHRSIEKFHNAFK